MASTWGNEFNLIINQFIINSILRKFKFKKKLQEKYLFVLSFLGNNKSIKEINFMLLDIIIIVFFSVIALKLQIVVSFVNLEVNKRVKVGKYLNHVSTLMRKYYFDHIVWYITFIIIGVPL